MAGHVNMMDDVLVSNLPFDALSLKAQLLSGHSCDMSKKRLIETSPGLPSPRKLFPSDDNGDFPALKEYMALARCLFSCKLVEKAFPFLTRIIESIVMIKVTWTCGSPIERILVTMNGDIVQAVQALKEVAIDMSGNLQVELGNLHSALGKCGVYCTEASLHYLFERAERQVRDAITMLYPNYSDDVSHGAGPALQVDPRNCHGALVETFSLGPSKNVPRLLNGLWQMSSPSWGSATSEKQTESLLELVEVGLTAADMADHYGDAELLYGDFRNRLPDDMKEHVLCITKWCIFKPVEKAVTPQWVLDNVMERSRRVHGRIELLQFHWQDYNSKDYLQILALLVGLTRTRPDLVSAIGLCNFDSEHTEEVCEYLLRTIGIVGVVSNQVQFSLFDSRPLRKMVHVAEKYGLKLLTYGSFCGGMLSSQWLNQPPPEIYGDGSVSLTPSQRKYIDIIQTWSSWEDFQVVLKVLADIGRSHQVSLTNVATRWVLQQKSVGAVIVGTRLGLSSRWRENMKAFGWILSESEMLRINEVALGKSQERSHQMMDILGDCGSEYRTAH